MSLHSIKSKSQGFTIVELLIVVVVIAILAAITIVSYNGITNRANASAARSTASTVQKKAELYQAENGTYPTVTQLSTGTSNSWYLATTNFTRNAGDTANDGTGNPTATNGKTQVKYEACGSTGVKITYWGFGSTEGTNSSTVSGAKVLMLGTGCTA